MARKFTLKTNSKETSTEYSDLHNTSKGTWMMTHSQTYWRTNYPMKKDKHYQPLS